MSEQQHGSASVAPQPTTQVQQQSASEQHVIPTKKYLTVALILAIVTALEVSIFYIEALKGALVPLLLGLSFIKFVLVVLYFMHLRVDKAIFSVLLGAGMVMALGTFIAIGAIIP